MDLSQCGPSVTQGPCVPEANPHCVPSELLYSQKVKGWRQPRGVRSDPCCRRSKPECVRFDEVRGARAGALWDSTAQPSLSFLTFISLGAKSVGSTLT